MEIELDWSLMSARSMLINEFVYRNMLWVVGSLRVFLCNYVLYSFGLILNYVFRFLVGGDRKNELHHQTERDQFQESEIDGFREELVNFLFQSGEDVLEDVGRREEETESSAFMESVCDEEIKQSEGETESSVLMESESDINKDHKEREGETDCSVFMGVDSDVLEDKEKGGGETESCNFMEAGLDAHEDSEKRDEEKRGSSVFMETDSATTTSKCQYVSGKNISGFIEEPTAMIFAFREFYVGPNVSAISDNAFSSTGIIAQKESSEFLPGEEEKESVQEQRKIPIHHTSDQFGRSDSSDEDNLLFNENSLASDSESESESESSGSGKFIWGNSNNIDGPISYEFLGCNNSWEGLESESLKTIKEEKEEKEEKAEDEQIESEPHVKDLNTSDAEEEGVERSGKSEGKDEEGSKQEEEADRDRLEKTAEIRWKDVLAELGYDEENEEEFEWEHDDIVEQLKMELRNARQGGLSTILEEEEEEDEKGEEEEEEETESPKVVEDLKQLRIEERLEYQDQMDEIQEVYQSYEEKMRKLDILNYQTMHAIGLLQLNDPLKSTFPGANKPLISHNLWPRKSPKDSSDPLLKFVEELQKDLELVYVGQLCLSWEILSWQHKKAQQLNQSHSQQSRQYNLAAAEFQLFQVLMQRFIENEPFQGPRTHNFVKNRCVIRNLLQVPPIREDSMKEKKIFEGDEEDAVGSGRLAEMIKESMRVFWEFVRADRDYGNLILRVSHQSRTDLKDPAISDLLKDIRTHLHKKEKRLKDIVRSGNCIVRRFQKQHHREAQLNHEQLLAQVQLKLISRVLNMSKLRKHHLLWCYEKINRIQFVKKKVQVEPSFLLFPC